MKLAQIAEYLHSITVGDPDLEITGISTIETAQPGHLTFLSNRRYARHLETTLASAVILSDANELPSRLAGIVSDNPYLGFARALELFHKPIDFPRGIHPLAVIAQSATIGADVCVGPFSVIGENVKLGDRVTILSHSTVYPETSIGADSFIHSHCIVRERCTIGERVILQNGVVVGSDGFGYARDGEAGWHKIPQSGAVIIENDVEIGAGSVIDRATLGSTIVRRGAKIDNLVQVGHSSQVGENTLLCAQVGLAGSTDVGKNVILSGQVGAAGHLRIGDGVIATAQSGIPNSVPDGQLISGYPAIENRAWLRSSAVFAQLPSLQRELRQVQRRLKEIEQRLGEHANDDIEQ